jgi:predicted nucleic acid-binding protein
MKPRRVLADTGPIVAILSEADAHHERCVAELAGLRPPLYTCWPVVTEALWLVRQSPPAVEGLFRGFATGLFALLLLEPEALPWLEEFLRRYRKLGAQLADAALVYLAEREGIDTVFTLDRRDFQVYRYGKNRSLKLIPDLSHPG